MGVKTNSDIKDGTKYTFQRKGGWNIIKRCPIFTPDQESVVLIVENLVRVYNIQTGDCVRILETETVINELVTIQFPQNEDYNLYGCSDTGCITTWTWESGAVLREVNIQIPNNMKVVTFDLVNSNECFITAIGPKQKLLHTGTYSIKTGELLYEYKDMQPLYFDLIRVSLGWCNGDRFAAIINGTKILYIQNLYKPHLRSEIVNHNKLRITAVAAHHSDNVVAITDTLGRATIIRGNLYDYRSIAREVMHWHSLPPMAVCFSTQGNYFYTGGMEKVLVKWTLGHLASRANEKIFIPRLPGMIRYIATNNAYVAITLTNNSVVIANAQLRVVSTIMECGGVYGTARTTASSVQLSCIRPMAALLLPARPGHLQLYSTATDKLLYDIDITEMNDIPPERNNLLPLQMDVTCVAVSGNGSCLVTSEYRNDGVMYPEEKLKFWSIRARDASPFKLNTCVNLSHGGCDVVSLALDNSGTICVSAGGDQKFRIWKKEVASRPQKKISWSCLTACYYSSGVTRFISRGVSNGLKDSQTLAPGNDEKMSYMKEIDRRDDIVMRIFNINEARLERNLKEKMGDEECDMAGVAISQDGSLIAAWFGSKLTIWDTHLCTLRTTLAHPALRPRGVHVEFGNGDSAHYLVCTTEKCVAVWNLLSLTLKWLVEIHPTCLAADPISNKMAVLTTNNDLFVFQPQSSIPVLKQKQLVDPQTGVFKHCTFGPSSGGDMRIYMMRNNNEVYSLEPAESRAAAAESIRGRRAPAMFSAFSALLPEQRQSDVTARLPEVTPPSITVHATHAAQFLTAPSHMVPAISLLSTSFLETISGQLQSPPTQQVEDNIMEVDPVSSDDESADVTLNGGPYAPKTAELWTANYAEIKEKRIKRIYKDPFLDLGTTDSIFGL